MRMEAWVRVTKIFVDSQSRLMEARMFRGRSASMLLEFATGNMLAVPFFPRFFRVYSIALLNSKS